MSGEADGRRADQHVAVELQADVATVGLVGQLDVATFRKDAGYSDGWPAMLSAAMRA